MTRLYSLDVNGTHERYVMTAAKARRLASAREAEGHKAVIWRWLIPGRRWIASARRRAARRGVRWRSWRVPVYPEVLA